MLWDEAVEVGVRREGEAAVVAVAMYEATAAEATAETAEAAERETDADEICSRAEKAEFATEIPESIAIVSEPSYPWRASLAE